MVGALRVLLVCALLHRVHCALNLPHDAECEHDHYKLLPAFDHVAPQVYRDAPEHHRHQAQQVTQESIRIAVSAVDVYDPTRTCTEIGQEVMDFSGGTVVCDTQLDIIDNGKIESLLNHALPEALRRLRAVLNVRRTTAPLTLISNACPYFTIPPAHVSNGVADADVVLYVAAAKTRGNVIAWSGYCGTDQYNRPIAGRMNIGSQHLPSNWSARTSVNHQERLIRVLMHEVVHVLGFSFDFVSSFYPKGTLDSVTGVRGKTYPVVVFRGANAVKAAQRITGCASLAFVELEDQGGSGTVLSHLERRVYHQDLMTGVSGITPTSNVLTALSAALLADSGLYTVREDAAFESTIWGREDGCNFSSVPCLSASGGVNFPTYFCTDSDRFQQQLIPDVIQAMKGRSLIFSNFSNGSAVADALNGGWLGVPSQCVFDHLSRGDCKLSNSTAAIPLSQRYFASPYIGGNISLLDYCPAVVARWTTGGACFSEVAGGVWYDEAAVESTRNLLRHTPSILKSAAQGQSARCMNVVVVQQVTSGVSGEPILSWLHDSACVEVVCVASGRSLQWRHRGREWSSCSDAGWRLLEEHSTNESFTWVLVECPKYSSVCDGLAASEPTSTATQTTLQSTLLTTVLPAASSTTKVPTTSTRRPSTAPTTSVPPPTVLPTAEPTRDFVVHPEVGQWTLRYTGSGWGTALARHQAEISLTVQTHLSESLNAALPLSFASVTVTKITNGSLIVVFTVHATNVSLTEVSGALRVTTRNASVVQELYRAVSADASASVQVLSVEAGDTTTAGGVVAAPPGGFSVCASRSWCVGSLVALCALVLVTTVACVARKVMQTGTQEQSSAVQPTCKRRVSTASSFISVVAKPTSFEDSTRVAWSTPAMSPTVSSSRASDVGSPRRVVSWQRRRRMSEMMEQDLPTVVSTQ